MPNGSSKHLNSEVRSSGLLFAAVSDAFRAVAVVPPWPTRVRNHKGGGFNPVMPFHLCGCVKGSGLFAALIIRAWPDPWGYPAGDGRHIALDVRQSLIGVGETGGVAGAIVAATNPGVATLYYLPWQCLTGRERFVRWDDPRLVECGEALGPAVRRDEPHYSPDLREVVSKGSRISLAM